MMRALVTGCAGFIGSHLVERLLENGHDVIGIDNFSTFYDSDIKQQNLAHALLHNNMKVPCSLCNATSTFTFLPENLLSISLENFLPLLDQTNVVFHLAGQPGVRDSWKNGFGNFLEGNVAATQHLLESFRFTKTQCGYVPALIFASSSSVYGNAVSYPTRESDLPLPHSPYGVTKLAAEHLCRLYSENTGIPTVSLRLFTVYGPRQRPDMAFTRLFAAAYNQKSFTIFGNGSQIRDFTYVSDVVDAFLASAKYLQQSESMFSLFNIAGGSAHTLQEAIEKIENVVEKPLLLDYVPVADGDVTQTGGDVTLAQKKLDWHPNISLSDGLERQKEWYEDRYLHR